MRLFVRRWLVALTAVLVLLPLAALAQSAPGPLSPPDTSSPRATLQSFLDNFHEAVSDWYVGESATLAEAPLARALGTMDLSHLPQANRRERGIELAFQLQGILQRIELPPLDQVPDAEAVATGQIQSWRIPQTELFLERVQVGNRPAAFLFSQETVASLPQFFRRVQDLEVLPGPHAIPGAYDAYRIGPGQSVITSVATWIKNLPAPAYRMVLGEPLWKWCALLLVVAVAAPGIALMAWLGLRADRRLTHVVPALRLGQPAAAVGAMIVAFWLNHVFADWLRLTGGILVAATVAAQVLTFAAAAWLAFLVSTRIGETIIHAQNRRPLSLDAQLIRLSFKLLGIFGVLYIAVHAADTIGIPVGPLLAGVGVTGLAIALAVRPTMENVIAGFVLFADKAVRVGEFCVFGDKMGTIEEIGLRSTRVRGLDRTLITVPNAEFSQMQIVNFTRRDQMLFNPSIALRYETTTEQMRFILAKIREMLVRHPRVSPDAARIRFTEYAHTALKLDVFAYITSSDYAESLGIREDLNFRIKDIVEQSGARFALPAQTIYLGRENGLDPERIEEVHAEVDAWRSDGRLPFPDFTEAERAALAGTLAFPPKGSSAHRGT
ncbi:mechanosensitive ion channel family protein [Geminicoccus roseus]|uniref:mechanosensitive ion channel family protein n=1 Tax=Geminicoccus roseus TaxID=404900 RepID=UPI0003FE3AC9|nr:mechanosensitive ion channel family protein [Geminicoccus roseus]